MLLISSKTRCDTPTGGFLHPVGFVVFFCLEFTVSANTFTYSKTVKQNSS